MPTDPEALYIQLGRLVQAIPSLSQVPLSEDAHRWLGQLDALLSESDDQLNTATLRMKVDYLGSDPGTRWKTAQEITMILYRALARAELNAPIAARGAFIPAGNAFDAMAAIGNVLRSAKQSVFIVDPYMDEKALTDFAPSAAEGVTIRLLAVQQWHKPTLRPAQERWSTQYGASRPLEARLAPAKTLHDRLIIIDDEETWVLTQSLNAFAVRSPAAVVRVDDDTSALKIGAYAAIWAASMPV
jgi:hypothetical protein